MKSKKRKRDDIQDHLRSIRRAIKDADSEKKLDKLHTELAELECEAQNKLEKLRMPRELVEFCGLPKAALKWIDDNKVDVQFVRPLSRCEASDRHSDLWDYPLELRLGDRCASVAVGDECRDCQGHESKFAGWAWPFQYLGLDLDDILNKDVDPKSVFSVGAWTRAAGVLDKAKEPDQVIQVLEQPGLANSDWTWLCKTQKVDPAFVVIVRALGALDNMCRFRE